MKIKAILVGIAVCSLVTLYSYFVVDTVETMITDARMVKGEGRFMIATEVRPFINEDAKYRFTCNSGTLQNEAVRLLRRPVRIKKYGWRVPLCSRHEKVVKIEEVK